MRIGSCVSLLHAAPLAEKSILPPLPAVSCLWIGFWTLYAIPSLSFSTLESTTLS